MLSARSHSVSELERLTGFDRRTIVYYIQQGLVARPGRRGPNTRYPAEALARLLFIRGVKVLQNQGLLLNVTLGDIRRAIVAAGDDRIGEIVARNLPVEDVAPLLAAPGPAQAPAPRELASATPAVTVTPPPAQPPPAAAPPRERRAFGLADAAVRQRFAPGSRPPAVVGAPRTESPAPVEPAAPAGRQDSPAIEAQVPAAAGSPAELGALLRELEIRPGLSGRRLAPGASEQWTEIPITSRVFLSVRGLSADDAPLADAVARSLKRLLRSA